MKTGHEAKLSQTKPASERFRLEIQALPDEVPATIRLRRLLKTLLRGYGFKVERVVPVAPEPAPEVSRTTTEVKA